MRDERRFAGWARGAAGLMLVAAAVGSAPTATGAAPQVSGGSSAPVALAPTETVPPEFVVWNVNTELTTNREHFKRFSARIAQVNHCIDIVLLQEVKTAADVRLVDKELESLGETCGRYRIFHPDGAKTAVAWRRRRFDWPTGDASD